MDTKGENIGQYKELGKNHWRAAKKNRRTILLIGCKRTTAVSCRFHKHQKPGGQEGGGWEKAEEMDGEKVANLQLSNERSIAKSREKGRRKEI